MASKVLQTPSIIGISGSVIRILNPDISNNIKTYLSAPIAAAGTSMTVHDNNGLSDNDWLLVGAIGDSESEITDINGAVTRGQSLTVTNYLSFGHEVDAPVTKLQELGIKIYGAATDGGSGTIIESIDAIIASGRQLVDAVMISWNNYYTEWNLISTDTSYAFYYATFTDGTTESPASDYVAASGSTSNSVSYFVQQALDLTNARIDERISYPFLIRSANDCQNEISQFTYTDTRNGKMIMVDWPFEEALDTGTITMETNKNTYDLSSLNTKYKNRGVITAQMGTLKQWKQTDIDDMTIRLENKPNTQLSSGASIGDTTLTVTSNAEFASSGQLYVDGQTITYTGKIGTTQFTGVPSAGTGSVTANISSGVEVWQNLESGLPEYYTIFENKLILDRPIDGNYNNYPLRIRYFKSLTALTQASDTTTVTFSNCFQYYIASKIEERRQNVQKAQFYYDRFMKIVKDNALHEKSAAKQYMSRYRFIDPQAYFELDSSDREYKTYT